MNPLTGTSCEIQGCDLALRTCSLVVIDHFADVPYHAKYAAPDIAGMVSIRTPGAALVRSLLRNSFDFQGSLGTAAGTAEPWSSDQLEVSQTWSARALAQAVIARATPASWRRLATPSLPKTWLRWLFTVAVDTNIRTPISSLVRPSTTSSTAFRSAGVKLAHPDLGRPRRPRRRRA